jgi:outer membrane receptor protein involved in Fe transport
MELRFGGERRIFLNAYFQPDDTAGGFEFSPNQTMQSNVSPDPLQGNALASMLLGYFDSNSGMAERPSVANKSVETSFFIQDNWRITSRLTLNLGLRYEFSTPYTERYNREAFTCFTCDGGITVPGVEPSTGRRSWLRISSGTRILLTITSGPDSVSPTGWTARPWCAAARAFIME